MLQHSRNNILLVNILFLERVLLLSPDVAFLEAANSALSSASTKLWRTRHRALLEKKNVAAISALDRMTFEF
jgi:hypothetical protein